MPTIVGVRLRNAAKTFWFDPGDLDPSLGDPVVVMTERGEQLGEIVEASRDVAPSQLPAALKPVLRRATDEDQAEAERMVDRERDAMRSFREAIGAAGLDMKPVDVEYLLDGGKAVFYFSAEERVDFRDLVRDLSSRLKIRVDMRQVGVRDEARMVGGVGHCGQELCCARLGGEFNPVSIRMAKEQDLPLNPLKISGSCGRLMCCLRYEYDAYKDFKTRAPKRGSLVSTPQGDAKVTGHDTPRETVSLRFEDGSDVKMPLASMECGKGGTCPCAVGAEALEAVRGTPSPLRAAAGSDKSSGPSRPRKQRRPSKDSGGGEKSSDGSKSSGDQKARGEKRSGGRRRSGGGQKASGQRKSEGQPKTAPKSSEAGAKSGDEAGKSEQRTGRRRRRRRPRGGGGGAPAQGV